MRPTNIPNLVEIGSQVAPPHSGEMSLFCDFCSPLFSFPHLAYKSHIQTDSHAELLERRVLFHTRVYIQSLGPSKPLLECLRSRKRQNFDPVWTSIDLQQKSCNIRALKSKILLNVEIIPQRYIVDWTFWTRNSFLLLTVQQKVHRARWLPPPSLISKYCCHSFTSQPILTKLGGKIATLI